MFSFSINFTIVEFAYWLSNDQVNFCDVMNWRIRNVPVKGL